MGPAGGPDLGDGGDKIEACRMRAGIATLITNPPTTMNPGFIPSGNPDLPSSSFGAARQSQAEVYVISVLHEGSGLDSILRSRSIAEHTYLVKESWAWWGGLLSRGMEEEP